MKIPTKSSVKNPALCSVKRILYYGRKFNVYKLHSPVLSDETKMKFLKELAHFSISDKQIAAILVGENRLKVVSMRTSSGIKSLVTESNTLVANKIASCVLRKMGIVNRDKAANYLQTIIDKLMGQGEQIPALATLILRQKNRLTTGQRNSLHDFILHYSRNGLNLFVSSLFTAKNLIESGKLQIVPWRVRNAEAK